MYFWMSLFSLVGPIIHNKFLPKSQPYVFLDYNSSQSVYLCYNFKTGKLYTSRHVYFVKNIFPYSFVLTTTFSLSPASIPTYMPLSGLRPLNHIQIIPTLVSQNLNSTSTASSLPTASQNLSSPLSIPTSLHTSSPPHVLPNSIESSPLSNHYILYTLGSSPSMHLDSSSCSLGPKQPSHPMVTRSKNGTFKPKQLHLATKFPLSDQIGPFCLS